MTVFGTLHAVPDSLQTNKILVAAAFGNRELKVEVPKDVESCVFGCPLSRLPCFESSSGQKLCDANAISCFLCDALNNKSSQEQAEILQWIGIADNDFVPHVLAWVLPSLSAMAFNKTAVEKAKHDLFERLNALDKYLLSQTFLVGERFSVADIILACDLLPAYQHVSVQCCT
ncbi:unnamed protein product [Soboliphyme baturini]|uniref:GST C-terminal domain-containing protein n=1 Tax=Soboliphyme baturini TaxID=241478 RepID=A0A183J2H7_9BILA|nr:unnamed protein product [Soboliphyme baturini]